MSKKWFVVVLSVMVMSWSAAALAGPITYSVSEYSASANAAWMVDSPASSATPPVSAAAVISENLQASGLADLDKVEGYAKNFESTREYVTGQAANHYEFTNCSRIGVSFEYAAYAYAETAMRQAAGYSLFDLLGT